MNGHAAIPFPKSDHTYFEWVTMRITLMDVEPIVYRRISVPGTIYLSDLHEVIQIAMGWTNSHMHKFDIAGACYGMVDPNFADFTENLCDEADARLIFSLADSSSFYYSYDFGDGWEHVVTVEDRQPFDKPMQYAMCVAGANACPPEDIGGPSGYELFLEALNDKTHPDHDDMVEWFGGSFDTTAFDIIEVNRQLKCLRLD